MECLPAVPTWNIVNRNNPGMSRKTEITIQKTASSFRFPSTRLCGAHVGGATGAPSSGLPQPAQYRCPGCMATPH